MHPYVLNDLLCLGRRIAITIAVWSLGVPLYILACASMGLLGPALQPF